MNCACASQSAMHMPLFEFGWEGQELGTYSIKYSIIQTRGKSDFDSDIPSMPSSRDYLFKFTQ